MSELPEGWVSASLGELCEVNPKHPHDLDRSMQVSFVPMPAVSDELGVVMDHDHRLLDEIWKGYTHFQEEDVIFAKITPCMENGKIAIAKGLKNGIACGSTELFVLRCPQGLSNRLLWYFLRQQSFRAEAEQHMSGAVGQRRVPRPYLEAFEFNLPPEKEQLRIVSKLDALFARTKIARLELDRIPTLIQYYKRSVLSKAFSGELTQDWREGRGVSAVATTTLADVCTSVTDGDHQAPPKAERGIPFITIAAMNTGEICLEKATRFVPASYYSSLSEERKARKGDVLFSVTGSIGIPASVNDDRTFVFQRHIAILRPNPELIRSQFLLYLLRAPQIMEQALRVATGIAQLTIPLRGLRSFVIPGMSLAEQDEIIRQVEAAFTWLTHISTEHRRSSNLLTRLEDALLGKAFRGELVPQNPTDNPASVLLERIQAERRQTEPSSLRGRGRTQEKKATVSTRGRASMMAKKRSEVSESYLSELLQELGGSAGSRELWQRSKMDVDEFYKLLRDEVKAGRIVEGRNEERLEVRNAA